MKKGDKFVVELEYRGDACAFHLIGSNDVALLYEDCVARAAAAYAAKAAPAPVSTAWEPKPGDRVLVEASYSCDDEYGNSVVEIPYSLNGKDGMFPARPVNRSAIVGPAPVRARFANGDTAFCISTMTRVTVYDNVGKNQWRTTNGDNMVWLTDDADLLTLDEARERLGKK